MDGRDRTLPQLLPAVILLAVSPSSSPTVETRADAVVSKERGLPE
jgi:hypothetical protein